LNIDKRNNLANIDLNTKQYRNMAAIYRCRRHAELNSQASTQGCNTLRLTYARSHRGSAYYPQPYIYDCDTFKFNDMNLVYQNSLIDTLTCLAKLSKEPVINLENSVFKHTANYYKKHNEY